MPSDVRHGKAVELLMLIRARNAIVPVYLSADRSLASTVPLESLSQVDDFIWLMEDTPVFISGRLVASMRRYREEVLPPMF
jgi:hypothetical protein